LAVWFDPSIVDLNNLNYQSTSCILFQRSTVIFTDFLFIYASYRLITGPFAQLFSPGVRLTMFLLTVSNVGLFIVDHMHFQYNGMLLGWLLLFIDSAFRGQDLRVSLYFSILVLSKHLFATLAPIVGIYLFRRALNQGFFGSNVSFATSLLHSSIILFCHAVIAALCITAAFAPFLLLPNGREQIDQMLQRLFPFARGLVHAYWAPNFWALYLAFDKISSLVLPVVHQPALLESLLQSWAAKYPFIKPLEQVLRVQIVPWLQKLVPNKYLSTSFQALPKSTSGLVGDFAMFLLPRIQASHCLIILIIFLIPLALRILFASSEVVTTASSSSSEAVTVKTFPLPRLFVRACMVGSFTAFVVGYHAHEKAILPVWVLQTLLVGESSFDKLLFCLISASASVSLFPLIPGTWEWCLKVLMTVAFHKLAWYLLDISRIPLHYQRALSSCYAMLSLLVLYTDVLHPLVYKDGMPFFPLMLTSCVCALILCTCWVLSYFNFLFRT
jgi:alpha-1,3-glucosyltransferase